MRDVRATCKARARHVSAYFFDLSQNRRCASQRACYFLLMSNAINTAKSFANAQPSYRKARVYDAYCPSGGKTIFWLHAERLGRPVRYFPESNQIVITLSDCEVANV